MSWRAIGEKLFTNVGHQTHKAGPFNRQSQSTLECGAGSATLAILQFTLRCAQFLQIRHILIIHKGGTRTAFFGTKSATIFSVSSQLFLNHETTNLFAIYSGDLVELK